MEDKEIKLLEEYLEEARDENSFTDCEGLFEDKFFISLDKLLKRYKDLEEEVESQDKTIDKLVEEQEEREKYTHSLEEENKRLKAFEDFKLKNDYIPISVIQNKIDELDRRIDYLNTELNKCYIEREKLGTETDIDNNETVIFCMEQEREYRYEQKQVLQELLEERNK